MKILSSQQRVIFLEKVTFENANFSDIHQDLVRDAESNSLKIASLPKICANTSYSRNNRNLDESFNTSAVLDSQDQDV